MRFQTYEQFWPYYLHEHRHRATRALHLAGTGAGLLICAADGRLPGELRKHGIDEPPSKTRR
jgi:hypothetical protein